jgi:hypothetical protein
MSLALERTLAPAVGWPESPAFEEQESKLNIAVIFTAVEPTLAALKHAGDLARNLGRSSFTGGASSGSLPYAAAQPASPARF